MLGGRSRPVAPSSLDVQWRGLATDRSSCLGPSCAQQRRIIAMTTGNARDAAELQALVLRVSQAASTFSCRKARGRHQVDVLIRSSCLSAGAPVLGAIAPATRYTADYRGQSRVLSVVLARGRRRARWACREDSGEGRTLLSAEKGGPILLVQMFEHLRSSSDPSWLEYQVRSSAISACSACAKSPCASPHTTS